MQVHGIKKSCETLPAHHFQITRLLEPVEAIQVRQPKTFVIAQCDGNGVIMDGNEFERAVVIIMEFVTRHAMEVCERVRRIAGTAHTGCLAERGGDPARPNRRRTVQVENMRGLS
jgi:hypothetical protein